MTYTTDARLILRTGERVILSWAATCEGVVDPEKLDAARVYGYNCINSHLQTRYGDYLPFVGDAIPDILKDIEDSLAIFWLASTNQQAGEMYIFAYKEAMRKLEQIAAGDIPLVSDGEELPNPGNAVTSGNAVSTTRNWTPVFSRKNSAFNSYVLQV